jgi:hypothetical protein
MLGIIKTHLFLILAFTLSSIYVMGQSQSNYKTITGFESHINARGKDIRENCKTATQLTEDVLADLPIGIAPQGCGSGTTILVVDSAQRVGKRRKSFSVYASVIIPGTSKPIAFAARNVGFGKSGLLRTTQTKLVLVSEQRIPVSESVTLVLPADGHNYVEFDCGGFKAINLKGNFVFSDNLLKPDLQTVPGATSVTASFEINTHDLNNIMASVSITPFKISGLDDLSFEVKNAVVDYSDIINPPGFSFPQAYQKTLGEDIALWRGFYLQDVTVRVKTLSDDDSKRKPVIISAKNLLIDDLGVSGQFTATNLLALSDGSANGWPLSIDQLGVFLQFNKITGGSMRGFVGVPFLGDDTLAYNAMVEQEENKVKYRFSVGVTKEREFKTPFSATVKLAPGSTLTLEKDGNGKILPSALLHGTLSMDGKIKTTDVKFENLSLISHKPYLVGGDFSTTGKGQSKGAGFPIQINNIALRLAQGQVALGLDVSLNFMNKEDKGFAAQTRFDILASLQEDTKSAATGESTETQTRQKWKLDKVVVNKIALDCKTNAFTLKGALSLFDNDPVYGDGFHGNLAFALQAIMNKPVTVNAYFGSKEDYRYWHLDANVPNIYIAIGPMAINGMMGGATYKMRRQQPLLPDFSQLTDEKAQSMSTGANDNHMVYIPDDTYGMGFLAGVTLIVGNKNAVNADVMFDVTFNPGGGLKYIRFDGTVFFITPLESRAKTKNGEAPKSSMYAEMMMLYDNDNKIFHANMKTYINVAGVLMGTGQNGLVGESVIHVDKQDWYAYIGRPSAMFGVSVLGLATAQTYFMIGTKIDNLPLPPSEVRQVFGKIDLSLMRDDLAAAGGKGFATGVHFRVGVDSKDKLRPFYVVMTVGAGTDVMLRNYGNSMCAGGDGRIGINGWYASGQAYVFLTGKVGLRVKKRNFDIVSLGLAALLQAQLPNPVWMKGMLAGEYKVLGGLVKGKFNLKFEVGEQCELINPGGELEDIEVIADIKPDQAGNDISVFSAPQVSFNTGIGEELKMMDLQDNLNTYRILLDNFTIQANKQPVQGKLTWNAAKDVAIIKTADILPPKTVIRISVSVHWEKRGDNGLWEPVRDNSNQTINETKESTFTTGEAPNFIPEENVTYSYPIKYQHNLYRNESGAGYVKLNYAQEYLFTKQQGLTVWDYLVRFRDNRGKTSEVPLNFSLAESQVTFNYPPLEKESVYTMTFIKRPQGATGVDENLRRQQVTQVQNEDNEVATASNKLEGSLTQAVETEIYSSVFRTSIFSTFREKWTSLGSGRDDFDVAKGNIIVLGKRFDANESFDEFELNGKEGMPPLVTLAASPETPWFKDKVSPRIYDLYPYDKDIAISWRKPIETIGLKPLKGVLLQNAAEPFKLTDAHVSCGRAPSTAGRVFIIYAVPYYVYWDYNDLNTQIAAKYFDDWNKVRPAGVKRFLAEGSYNDIEDGNYPVQIQYSLPGSGKATFVTQMSIHY